MKWLNDVKVSVKIVALAVIAAIALFSVGYTGYSMLQDSNYRMSKMYNQKLKNMQMIGEMKYFMRDMQVHELNLADSKDAKEQEKNSKTIESIEITGTELTGKTAGVETISSVSFSVSFSSARTVFPILIRLSVKPERVVSLGSVLAILSTRPSSSITI